MTDRRHDARFSGALLDRLTITLRPGHSVVLVNLAPGGALVHSMRPLRPGGRVHVVLGAGGQAIQTAAQVIRCSVVAIDATKGVTYEGALKFDTRCALPWEPVTRSG